MKPMMSLAEVLEYRAAHDSNFSTALVNFCETFEHCWQAFPYKADTELRYSFGEDTLRFLQVNVRIGRFCCTRAFEWTYLYDPSAGYFMAEQGADAMRREMLSALQHVGLQVAKRPLWQGPTTTHHTLWVSSGLFDRVLQGGLSALPCSQEVKPGDMLRLIQQNHTTFYPSYRGLPPPQRSVDVPVTGFASPRDLNAVYPWPTGCGLVCFEPLNTEVKLER